MFFATTALQEFWDKNDKLLLAGSWCLPFNHEKEITNLRYEILKSPWLDAAKLDTAYHEVLQTYETYLSVLADFLNQHHKVDRSLRYWRILIGPWLHYYLDILYDRFAHIQSASVKAPGFTTRCLSPQDFQTPFDTLELVNLSMHDHYNLQLYSQIIELLGHTFKTSAADPKNAHHTSILPIGVVKNSNQLNVSPVRFLPLKRITINSLGYLIRLLGRASIQLADADMNDDQLLSLIRESRFRILPPLRHDGKFSCLKKRIAPKHPARTLLGRLSSSNMFQQIFVKTLPVNFPSLYLESYSDASRPSSSLAKKLPPILSSSFGWRFDESFKFLAAEAQERGNRLVAIQHGGGYGTYKRHAQEIHESKCADSFWVWGWADQMKLNLKNVPSPRLAQKIHRRKPRKNSILYLATAQPQYPIGFHSSPLGSQWENYFAWQVRFLKALSPKIRAQINFRAGIYEYGFYNQQRLQKHFPTLRFDAGKAIEKVLETAKLVIIDYGGATVFLETLAKNIPTLHFYDPSLWPIRDSVVSLYETLKQTNILADSPEKAAAFAQTCGLDPHTWWEQPSVQDARRSFVHSFALHKPDWEKDWVAGFQSESTCYPSKQLN